MIFHIDHFSLTMGNQIASFSLARRKTEQLSGLLNQQRKISDHTSGELDARKNQNCDMQSIFLFK